MKAINELVQEVVARFHQKSAQQEKPDLVELTRQIADENNLDMTQIETLAPLVNKAFLVATGTDPEELVLPSNVLAAGFNKAASVEEPYSYIEYSMNFQNQQKGQVLKSASEEPSRSYQNGSHGYNAMKDLKGALTNDMYALRSTMLQAKQACADHFAKAVDTVKLIKMYGVDSGTVAQHVKSASMPEQLTAMRLFFDTQQVKSASRASSEQVGELCDSLVDSVGAYLENYKQHKFASEALALKEKSSVLLSQLGEVVLK